MFEKIDPILQADTDDLIELARIANLDHQELSAALKETGLFGIDLRNQDLSELEFDDIEFDGVIANAHTKIDLTGKARIAFFDSAERYFEERLLIGGCCSQYDIDERIHLLRESGRRGVDERVTDALVTLFDGEGIWDTLDITEEEYDLSGGFLHSLLKNVFNDSEVGVVFRPENSPGPDGLWDYQKDEGHLRAVADQIIFVSQLELIHEFDLQMLRGDIVKFFSDRLREARNADDSFECKYSRYHFFLRTLPVLSLNLNATATVGRFGEVRVERVWMVLTPAVYEPTPKADQLRPSDTHYREQVVQVPKRLRRIPALRMNTGEYDYDSARTTPIVDMPEL